MTKKYQKYTNFAEILDQKFLNNCKKCYDGVSEEYM